MKPEPLAVSAATAAEAFDLPRSTVYAMVRDGRLPKVPGLGKTVRIPWSALVALVESSASPSPVRGAVRPPVAGQRTQGGKRRGYPPSLGPDARGMAPIVDR